MSNFEVFGNVVKHCLECLIYHLNRNYNEGENEEIIVKNYANEEQKSQHRRGLDFDELLTSLRRWFL